MRCRKRPCRAIALSLAQEGVRVAVTGRNADKLAKRWMYHPDGRYCPRLAVDLAAPERFDSVIADIRQQWAISIFWSTTPVARRPHRRRGQMAQSGNSSFQ